jgi:Tfp pilus assembly protein PilX
MGNLYRFKAACKGTILISALLFLLVLTLLVMSILQTGLLESKMSTNYQDGIFVLQKAEINLTKKEQQIGRSNKLPVGVEIISTAVCGVTFYRVKAEGEYQKAKQSLQSTFAIINNTAHCRRKSLVTPGRQSWRLG